MASKKTTFNVKYGVNITRERTGGTISDRVYYTAVPEAGSRPITAEDAKEIQTEMGDHPCGYGFMNFNVAKDGIATWKCLANCS